MIYCSQGHQNAPDNRFCYFCGESLAPQGIGAGLVLGDRYRIRSELGHGGFGRTYLAEDINRFNEPCVLKEFAPQVQTPTALQKAEELFAREAGVLYQLQHPQIPRFRELFRAIVGGQVHLFLVQDYVHGETYRSLLETRRRQGTAFSELEVRELVLQLLPVLQYIHSLGVVHRDIAPDNLILRDADRLPVLIDFGGVKQVAVAVSQFAGGALAQPNPPLNTATRLGKIGYAPPEQMESGQVFPHSDLYALGVTALVLLTGKEPQELFTGPLPQQVGVSPDFMPVLMRMVAVQPIDRYPSAEAVLHALGGDASLTLPPHSRLTPDPPATQTTPTIATPIAFPNGAAVPQPAQPFAWGKLLLLALLAAGVGLGWGTRDRWLPLIASPPEQETPTPTPTPTSNFSPEEQARKAEIRDRRTELGVDPQFHIALTNATFFERYPRQQGRTLSDRPEDAEWRQRWDAIAIEWLDLLEENLSADARSRLGSYSSGDRDRWKRQVNQLGVGSRALNDLTDARFFNLFPEVRDETEDAGFLQQPIGQVWQGFAQDQVGLLQSGETLESVRFAAGSTSKRVSGNLDPGGGRVYTAELAAGQTMEVRLQAPNRTTLFSVYVPRPDAETPFLLSDSTETVWSGTLPQAGIYEIVVVSSGSEAIDYRLELTVEDPEPPAIESPPLAPETSPEDEALP